MDGYAVAGSGPWSIIGESRAGHPFADIIAPGQAIAISTGALMPQGGETVLIKENASRAGDSLAALGDPPEPGRHVRRTGLDFEEGDTLLEAGDLFGAAQLALAVGAGNTALDVRRRPHVTIIDSGDELDAGSAQGVTHKIPASNGAMLTAMVRSLPCDTSLRGPVPDRLDALLEAVGAAKTSDVIVTSGGASVGDHDLLRPALEQWGAQLDFWRVAMKPGKPLLVARRGRKIVLGLPGNPVSSFVTGFFFLLPLLRKLLGASQPLPRPIELPCADSLPKSGDRHEFVRARWDNGQLRSISQRDSSALHALARTDALIDRPANADEVKAGTYVPAYLLENG